jgi:hypothetical protein
MLLIVYEYVSMQGALIAIVGTHNEEAFPNRRRSYSCTSAEHEKFILIHRSQLT